MPKGTVLTCRACYDNSAGNPANPDPSAWVNAGPQSWDEMFNGYFEFALADQDLTKPDPRAAFVKLARFLFTGPALFAWPASAAGFLLLRRVQGMRSRKR